MSDYLAPFEVHWDDEAEQWIAIPHVPGPAGTVVFRFGCLYLEFDRIDPDVLTRMIIAPEFDATDERLRANLFESDLPAPGGGFQARLRRDTLRLLAASAALDDDDEVVSELPSPTIWVHAVEQWLARTDGSAVGADLPAVPVAELGHLTSDALASSDFMPILRAADARDPAALEWLISALDRLGQDWGEGSGSLQIARGRIDSMIRSREAVATEPDPKVVDWPGDQGDPIVELHPTHVSLRGESGHPPAERLLLTVEDLDGVVFGALGHSDEEDEAAIVFDLPEGLSLVGTDVRIWVVSLHERLRDARESGVRALLLELWGSPEASAAWEANGVAWLASGARGRASAAFRRAAQTATNTTLTRRYSEMSRTVLGQSPRSPSGMWPLFTPRTRDEHRPPSRKTHEGHLFRRDRSRPEGESQWLLGYRIAGNSAAVGTGR